MTKPDAAERIRQVRQETVAAIEERARLGDAVRRELIVLLCDGVICRDGATDALDAWGLEPIPQVWTVLADGQLSYALTGSDAHHASDRRYEQILEQVHRVLPAVSLWLGRAGDAAAGDDGPVPRQRLAVPAILRIDVTAGYEDGVLTAAQQLVSAGVPALTDAGITLTDLCWSAIDEPQDLDRADLLAYARTPADIPAVTLPEGGADLSVATRDRAVAAHRLDTLRRKIRARAIRALRDDEIGSDLQETGSMLEPILIRLGLGALPRAHQVAVTVDLTLRLTADSADQALGSAYTVMGVFVERSDRSWRWARSGCTLAALPSRDAGRWPVGWRLEYATAVRGHLDAADATAAADAAVRAALSSALAGVEYDVRVAASGVSYGFDPYANPSTD